MYQTLFSQPRSHSRQGSNLDKFTTLKVSDQIWSTVVPSLPSSFLSLSDTTVTLPLPGRESNWNIPFVSSIYRLQRAQHHLSMILHNGRTQNRKGLPIKNFLILKADKPQEFIRPCLPHLGTISNCTANVRHPFIFCTRMASNVLLINLKYLGNQKKKTQKPHTKHEETA